MAKSGAKANAGKQRSAGGDLLTKRLLFVTGKGGVGKTIVAAALGLAASRAGLRTMVCELDPREHLGQLFGVDAAGTAEVEMAPDLYAVTIDQDQALKEYMLLQLKVRALYELLFNNRIFEYFAAATPGLQELLTIGKIWEIAQPDRLTKGAAPYDLVIVDAPATGHAVAMLEAPTTFRRVARVGPIHRQAGKIERFLHDPAQTAVIAVATAEEMPVNETLTLQQRLAERLGLALDLIVANALEPALFSSADIAKLDASDNGAAPIDAARRQHARRQMQDEQLGRLKKMVKTPIVELPFVYEKSLGRAELSHLTEQLMESLGIEPAPAADDDEDGED